MMSTCREQNKCLHLGGIHFCLYGVYKQDKSPQLGGMVSNLVGSLSVILTVCLTDSFTLNAPATCMLKIWHLFIFQKVCQRNVSILCILVPRMVAMEPNFDFLNNFFLHHDFLTPKVPFLSIMCFAKPFLNFDLFALVDTKEQLTWSANYWKCFQRPFIWTKHQSSISIRRWDIDICILVARAEVCCRVEFSSNLSHFGLKALKSCLLTFFYLFALVVAGKELPQQPNSKIQKVFLKINVAKHQDSISEAEIQPVACICAMEANFGFFNLWRPQDSVLANETLLVWIVVLGPVTWCTLRVSFSFFLSEIQIRLCECALPMIYRVKLGRCISFAF